MKRYRIMKEILRPPSNTAGEVQELVDEKVRRAAENIFEAGRVVRNLEKNRITSQKVPKGKRVVENIYVIKCQSVAGKEKDDERNKSVLV